MSPMPQLDVNKLTELIRTYHEDKKEDRRGTHKYTQLLVLTRL